MFSSSLFCDTCGAANRQQAIFCASCGRRLHTTTAGSISNTLTGLLVHHHMLNQRYRVIDQVGKGGFGAVYKAEDTYFGDRRVAVKEMSQSNLSPQELAEAVLTFKQEALLLAGLKHPNLPSIYDQFSDTGRCYLVMDFIEGETLEAHLENKAGSPAGGRHNFPIEKALDIAIQLCSVLDYLHTRQPPIIFRDLKPANVMLTDNGHIYLIDFGIARHFKPWQAKDTSALGSSGYAAPEQYGKAQTTPRTDLYGLGATLHQMLTGDDPSETPFHFAPLHLQGSPALTRLAALVKQMLELTVTKRPASAAHVKQQLQEIADQHRLALTTPLTASSGTAPVISTGINAKSGMSVPPGYRPPAAAKRMVTPQHNTLFICNGHSSRVTALAWSPDSKQFASASYDKTIRIWDAANGNPLFTYRGHAARVNALAWSPDGRRLVSASDDYTAQIWDVTTGNQVFTYRGHAVQVTAVAWSPDGHYLASGDEDKIVQIWQMTSNRPLSTQTEHTTRINALAWSPDSKRLASASNDKTIRVWDPLKAYRSSFFMNLLSPSRGHLAYSNHRGHVNALAWSPDGRYIASGGNDKTIQVWSTLTGQRSFIYRNRSAGVNTVAWSPDNHSIVFGSNDRTAQVWDVQVRKPLATYLGHTNYVTSVAWSPDGSRIASAGVDHTVQVWTVK